jgi:hypothetical protein
MAYAYPTSKLLASRHVTIMKMWVMILICVSKYLVKLIKHVYCMRSMERINRMNFKETPIRQTKLSRGLVMTEKLKIMSVSTNVEANWLRLSFG